MSTNGRKTYSRLRCAIVYLSLPALLVYLYQQGFLILPRVYSPGVLFVSLLLLLAGFLLMAEVWRQSLRLHQQSCSIALALRSIGITVFAKYIPGKIWGPVGQAAQVLETTGAGLPRVLAASLDYQLLTLWSGLTVGGLLLFGLDWPVMSSLVYLLAVLAGFVVLLLPGRWRLLNKLLPEGMRALSVSDNPVTTLRITPYALLVWLLWSVSFYCLCLGLTAGAIPPQAGLAFALAGALAILSPITPAGLGVREGLMVVLLTALGIDATTATTLSLASRLWFMSGEACLFLQALVLGRFISRDMMTDE